MCNQAKGIAHSRICKFLRSILILSVFICVHPWIEFPVHAAPETLTGIDVLEAQDFAALKGKRVGLITNQTGIDRKGRGNRPANGCNARGTRRAGL